MHKNIELKVGIFLISVFVAVVLATVFIAYKKGLFEDYFYVTLTSKSGDSILQGVSVNFRGFEIGKISQIQLDDEAQIVLQAKIPTKYKKWVNSSSEFTLEKPLIGSPKIVVRTPDLKAEDINEVKMLKIIDGIDELIFRITPIVEQAEVITSNIEKITSDLAKRESIIAMITGDNSSSKDMVKTIRNLEETTRSLNKMLTDIDGSIYGEYGIIADIKEVFLQLDLILVNVEKITADIANETGDVSKVKREIDIAIKNANDLLIEIESKIPFKEKKEVKLP